MLQVALYTRVSDKEKQGDNTSIPSQLAAMRQYAAEQSMDIIAEFVETESASKYGEGLERSELAKARALARAGTIHAILFYSRNRFTRDIGDGVILRRELQKLGVKLICYHPHPHEITSDKELINILEDYISEQYIENLREATMRGMVATAKAGVYSQGDVPYGYVLEGRKLEKRLVIVEDEARIVRLVYEWFVVDNLSTTQIANKLTDAGIPTPGDLRKMPSRKRSTGVWSKAYIRLMLRQEAYAGTCYVHKFTNLGGNKRVLRPREEWIPISIPAIVDRAIWEQAQERLTARDYERRQKFHHMYTYLMARRVNCACSYYMSGHTRKNPVNGTSRHYYACHSREGALGFCGNSTHFHAELVDGAVWEFIKSLLRDPAAVLAGYKEAQEGTQGQDKVLRQQLALVDNEVTDYTAKLSETLDQRRMAKSPTLKTMLDERAEEYAGILDELKAKRDKLAAKLSEETITDEHIHSIVAFAEEMRAELDDIETTNDVQAKRRLVEALNLRITLRVDAERARWVDIHWLQKRYPRRVSTKETLGRRS